MNVNIEDISNESSCDHCGGDIHGEPPFCEDGLIFCSRDCARFVKDFGDIKIYLGDYGLIYVSGQENYGGQNE